MTQIVLTPESMFLIILHNGSKGKEGTISPPVSFIQEGCMLGELVLLLD